MTKEEAIETLLVIQKYYNDNDIDGYVGFDEEDNKALDMAIKALEQEPCECTEHPCLGKLCRYYKEPCEDAISRKEVIETIEWYDKDRYIECSNDMIEYIKKMPSVTPQYTEAEIQNMQEMEQAEIQKAYELGKAEQPKIGHWKRVSADKYVQHAMYYYRCSECDNDIIGEYNYCPHCGAKMEV